MSIIIYVILIALIFFAYKYLAYAIVGAWVLSVLFNSSKPSFFTIQNKAASYINLQRKSEKARPAAFKKALKDWGKAVTKYKRDFDKWAAEREQKKDQVKAYELTLRSWEAKLNKLEIEDARRRRGLELEQDQLRSEISHNKDGSICQRSNAGKEYIRNESYLRTTCSEILNHRETKPENPISEKPEAPIEPTIETVVTKYEERLSRIKDEMPNDISTCRGRSPASLSYFFLIPLIPVVGLATGLAKFIAVLSLIAAFMIFRRVFNKVYKKWGPIFIALLPDYSLIAKKITKISGVVVLVWGIIFAIAALAGHLVKIML